MRSRVTVSLFFVDVGLLFAIPQTALKYVGIEVPLEPYGQTLLGVL